MRRKSLQTLEVEPPAKRLTLLGRRLQNRGKALGRHIAYVQRAKEFRLRECMIHDATNLSAAAPASARRIMLPDTIMIRPIYDRARTIWAVADEVNMTAWKFRLSP